MLIRSLLFIAAIVTSLVAQATAQDKSIVVASTTSTQDSGLFDYLLPIFKQKTGVLAQGTGQALDTARRGVAMLTWCSSIPKRLKKDSCRKASG
jgi:tungstate transport system substrate-binding protein